MINLARKLYLKRIMGTEMYALPKVLPEGLQELIDSLDLPIGGDIPDNTRCMNILKLKVREIWGDFEQGEMTASINQ